MSATLRVIRTGLAYVMLVAHGSVGPSVSVDSSGPDGYKRLDYDGFGEPTGELVLPRTKTQHY